MLTRSIVGPEQRWYRALRYMGLETTDGEDPDEALGRMAADNRNRSSIVACLSAARENASQIREEISAEMWEQLNRLFHEVVRSDVQFKDDAAVMRQAAAVREGAFSFYGVTETTMSHGEGWRFVQLGKFTERACAVSLLLDAYFSTAGQADDLDWVTLLASCAAFESYCKVYTADLQRDRIAKFLLGHPDFPYSVRYSVERMDDALAAILAQSPTRQRQLIESGIGRLRASLTFTPVAELLAGDLHAFLNGILGQCRALHATVHAAYIDYPIEVEFRS
jgi:uncharacterized alpha-E superfamily protein